MQVRYQAAPRPDRTAIIAEKEVDNSPGAPCPLERLAAKNLDQLFEL